MLSVRYGGTGVRRTPVGAVLGNGTALLGHGLLGATQTPGGTGVPCAWPANLSPGIFRVEASGSATRPGRSTRRCSPPAASRSATTPGVGADNRLASTRGQGRRPRLTCPRAMWCCCTPADTTPPASTSAPRDWKRAGGGQGARAAAADRLRLPGLRRRPGGGRLGRAPVRRRTAGTAGHQPLLGRTSACTASAPAR